jgi:hypothetical protein
MQKYEKVFDEQKKLKEDDEMVPFVQFFVPLVVEY